MFWHNGNNTIAVAPKLLMNDTDPVTVTSYVLYALLIITRAPNGSNPDGSLAFVNSNLICANFVINY